MSTYNRTILLVAALAAASVAAILARAHAWPYWPTPFAVPFVLLVALATTRSQQADVAMAAVEPPSQAQHFREVLDRDTAVANVPVPSASANYDFLLSATVHWRPSPAFPHGINSASPGTLACNAIIERAVKQTGIENPVDYVQAQHRLAAILAVVQDDASEGLKVWATDVTLSMRPDDLDRLRRLDELNKQMEIWEHKRAIEREVSAYFSGEVLKDPGSAVAWWMAKHHERSQEEIQDAVELIGPLAQLAAAANNEELPEAFRRFVGPASAYADPTGPELDGAPTPGNYDPSMGEDSWVDGTGQAFEPQMEDHVTGFFKELGFARGSNEQTRFARQLADHCEQAGRYEAATRIRRSFSVPDFTDFNAGPAAGIAGDDDPGPSAETLWQ